MAHAAGAYLIFFGRDNNPSQVSSERTLVLYLPHKGAEKAESEYGWKEG